MVTPPVDLLSVERSMLAVRILREDLEQKIEAAYEKAEAEKKERTPNSQATF